MEVPKIVSEGYDELASLVKEYDKTADMLAADRLEKAEEVIEYVRDVILSDVFGENWENACSGWHDCECDDCKRANSEEEQ